MKATHRLNIHNIPLSLFNRMAKEKKELGLTWSEYITEMTDHYLHVEHKETPISPPSGVAITDKVTWDTLMLAIIEQHFKELDAENTIDRR